MNTGKYLCFEHTVSYTEDDVICPQCEKEIGETHDTHLAELLSESSKQYSLGKHCSTGELKNDLNNWRKT